MTDHLDSILDAAVADRRIVGGVLRVSRRGELVHARAVGLADREAGRAMTADTPFRLSSLTKPIVAVAALALVDRGRLALDAPVTRWLPDFRPRIGNAAPPITIHQLLTHTSGIGYRCLEPADGPYHRANVSDGMDQPGLALADNLRRLASAPLVCEPGTAFNYSLSIDVLGAVLERVADRPLPRVIDELVTGPLEIADLGFDARPGLAVPYADGTPPKRIVDGEPVPFLPGVALSFAPERAFDPASYPSGGAGMVGTAGGFHRFLEALRRRAIPTVAAARLDEVTRDQIAPLRSELLGDGWGWSYVGAVLRDPIAAQSPMHAGSLRWGGVYGHSWSLDPVTATTAVLVTNTTLEGMAGALALGVRQAAHA